MSGPLSGFTTLILRPTDRAAQLVELVRAAGGEAIVSPLISRAEIAQDSRAFLDSLTRDLASFSWVAVTSVNAVTELVQSMARTHPDHSVSEAAASVRWATVGPATTAALAQFGIVAEFEASENSAAGMLSDWPVAPAEPPSQSPNPDPSPSPSPSQRQRVLLPQGDLASKQLATGLESLGFTAVPVTVYHTVSCPATADALGAWKDGDVDLVVLTSGSVVREFVKQFDPHEVLPTLEPYVPAFIAIGSPTTRAALASGLSVDIVANNATNQGLFDALVRAATLLSEES